MIAPNFNPHKAESNLDGINLPAAPIESDFIDRLAAVGQLKETDRFSQMLQLVVAHFGCESGTIHRLEADGLLHLVAHTDGMPAAVLNIIRAIPPGKGMAGLAVERDAPVTACNIQSDSSGDVRPGAKATGMQGAIVVPLRDGSKVVGALGIANSSERVFTPTEVSLLVEVGQAVGRAMCL